MGRYAVFVDAGYLFAEGGKVLSGEHVPRKFLHLDVQCVVEEIKKFVQGMLNGKELLRIYWYDGAPRARGLIKPHQELAGFPDVKLRLGILTDKGQQKGVDTLIVTDMIELAQNRAISDAVLVSGDEDVRIGVQIAQKFGVRVHLLGIGEHLRNQSFLLRQEADVCHIWEEPTVSRFLKRVEVSLNDCIDSCLKNAMEKIHPGRVAEIVSSIEERGNWIPKEIDRILLACCSQHLQRELDDEERQRMREMARTRLLAKLHPGAGTD